MASMAEHKPIDPQSAIETIWKTSAKYAQSKANRVYLDEYRKSLKAILMRASDEKTSVAQEAAAYSDESYLAHLEALKTAVFQEEALRWRLIAAQAAIEVWRSQESSNRLIDRSAS